MSDKPHFHRSARALAALLAVLFVWVVAWGQEPQAAQPQAGAAFRRLVAGGDPLPANEATSGHGWAFLPGPEGGDGYLVHLVPRQGVLRASAGSVRLVTALKKSPLAIAGWNGEAFMLMAPPGDTATEPGERTLSSIRAVGPMSLGNWDYKPGERLELKASLPSDVIPHSMVGTSLGPLLVWERTAPSPSHNGELEIVMLDDTSTWRVLRPPPGFPLSAKDGEAHALSTVSGVLVAFRNAGEETLAVWRATPPPDLTPPPSLPRVVTGGTKRSGASAASQAAATSSSPPPGPVQTRWVQEGSLGLPRELRSTVLHTIGPASPHWLVRDEGQTLLAVRSLEGITVWRLDSSGKEPIVLWRSKELPPDAGVLSMGGLGSVTFLAFEPSAEARAPAAQRGGGAGNVQPAPDAGRLRAVEVSHSTAAVLADLAAHTDGFLTRKELWVLWLLFIGVGVVVLLVVVNTDGPQEVVLPEGTALATPTRRAIAAVLDIAVAIGVTGVLVGGTPAQWLSPATSATSSLTPMLCVIGSAFVLSVVGEATIGASPGKLLAGIRVLGLVPAAAAAGAEGGVVKGAKKSAGAPTVWKAARPRWHQALVRNAIRWFMPPMGLAMIVDNNWRHPGDLLGRTVVVTRFEPDSEEKASEDEEQRD